MKPFFKTHNLPQFFFDIQKTLVIMICISMLLPVDVADEESISAAVQAVQDQIGDAGLNILINNAGIRKPALSGALSATKKNDMMEVYETNVVGPFTIAKVGLFSADVGSTNTLLRK